MYFILKIKLLNIEWKMQLEIADLKIKVYK